MACCFDTGSVPRTLYATTTVCNQPPVPVGNCNTYSPGGRTIGLPNGGAPMNTLPPIPAPAAQ